MEKPIEQETIQPRVKNRRTHMANERTFLAWIRTSIGIMAFGFVLERFALITRQFLIIVGKQDLPQTSGPSLTGIVGISLMAAGGLIAILSLARFKTVERQIDEDSYQPSLNLDVTLAILVLSIGLFLGLYLYRALSQL